MAADGCSLVVMLPGGKDEQLTASASLHPLSTRLRQVREAVLLKVDQGVALLESSPHRALLALGDGGRHQDGPLRGSRQALGCLGLNLSVGHSSGALHLQSHGPLQQEQVAKG